MATTSVTPVVPGLNDIFPDLQDMPANPERIAQAASNVHLPAVRGIAAIGGLLSSAAGPNGDEIDWMDLHDIGFLLKHLGETAAQAHHLYRMATYWAQEGSSARADPGEN